MKKIMFNDKYGLTEAVLSGRKTMTRRIVPQHVLNKVEKYQEEYYNGALETISEKDAILSIGIYEYRYRFPQVGEVVAIAQRLVDIFYECKLERDVYHNDKGWNNKMFVKAKDMPHHIRITNIRVERLHDISDKDCLKEGVCENWAGYSACECTFPTPRSAFGYIINKISGKGTWERNPYVFVYEFELVD